jgi:hypothetical protein
MLYFEPEESNKSSASLLDTEYMRGSCNENFKTELKRSLAVPLITFRLLRENWKQKTKVVAYQNVQQHDIDPCPIYVSEKLLIPHPYSTCLYKQWYQLVLDVEAHHLPFIANQLLAYEHSG